MKQTLIANDASSRLGALPNSLPSLRLIWFTQLVKGLGPKLGIWSLGGVFSSLTKATFKFGMCHFPGVGCGCQCFTIHHQEWIQILVWANGGYSHGTSCNQSFYSATNLTKICNTWNESMPSEPFINLRSSIRIEKTILLHYFTFLTIKQDAWLEMCVYITSALTGESHSAALKP